MNHVALGEVLYLRWPLFSTKSYLHGDTISLSRPTLRLVPSVGRGELMDEKAESFGSSEKSAEPSCVRLIVVLLVCLHPHLVE